MAEAAVSVRKDSLYSNMKMIPYESLLTVVHYALAEDVGAGDATTRSTIPEDAVLAGSFLAKADGVIAGLEIAKAVFLEVHPDVRFEASVRDGAFVRTGEIFASVSGNGRALLTAERTVLNFLQRMSGIATATRMYVDAVKGTKAVILDTRKTAPGLRMLDKYAVRCGGGSNHRVGLFDMILIKDNHIDASGGISAAVAAVRSGADRSLPIEVECRTLDDVNEAVGLNVNRIMLDNMSLEKIREAVTVVGGRVPLEVSGNVTLATVRSIAETGIEYISVGALTHSVQALDISLKIHAGAATRTSK
jgi:nicotinate-nucleotide pyrophosphorylase (carboxylating)